MNANQQTTFIAEHLNDDVRQLLLHREQYPEVDILFCCQQIEGYQKARHKLPSLSKIEGWLFPTTLSLEQCSSEVTAQIKQHILRSHCPLITHLYDLTGGYGIDTYFLSKTARHTTYVERQQHLSDIAAHNFKLLNANIDVVNSNAEDFLSSLPHPTDTEQQVIYLDPARRSKTGSKVYRLEDSEPNIIELLPTLEQHASTIMLKLSPMLDIRQATEAILLADIKHIEHLHFYVIAVKNEVKELLCLIHLTNATNTATKTIYTAVMYPVTLQQTDNKNTSTDDEHLATNEGMLTDSFTIAAHEEQDSNCVIASTIKTYIYEPNAAILKLGAFKTIAERYQLEKIDINSHLYTSDNYIDHFPGRTFLFIAPANKKQLSGQHLNIISRNHPLSAEDIRRKYKIKEGDKDYLIATRQNNKPLLCLTKLAQK